MPLLMGDTGLDGSRTWVGMDSTHIPVVRPSALTYLLCGLSQVIFTPEYSVGPLYLNEIKYLPGFILIFEGVTFFK